MRPPIDILIDIKLLGRPVVNPLHAFRTGKKDPALLAWKAANPGGDEAYTALLEELEESERHQACLQHLERVGRRWSAESGLGSLTLGAVEAPQDTPALRGVREWRAGSARWCLLLGGVGTGKSVAAAWAMREAALLGQRSRYIPAARLMRLATFEGEGDELARVPWLTVDDVGTEHKGDFSASCWHDILRERNDRELRTCLTSNLDAQSLRARLGERLADCIAASRVVVHLKGKSMRRADAP